MNLMVLAETNGREIDASTLASVAFAQQWVSLSHGNFDILLAGGPEIVTQAAAWQNYGARSLIVAADAALQHPTAERMAALCMQAMEQNAIKSAAGTASSFGRDILPRLAGLMALPMVTDVLSVAPGPDGLHYRRPIYAGNLIMTVRIAGDAAIFSVRSTAFEAPTRVEAQSPLQKLEIDMLFFPAGTEWISSESVVRKRPELTAARVVVSGGRPLRDADTFERLLGGLADKLGGAVGATRAAVDSGIAPNELQVGQTGKIVAPDLYIAAGVSGSVQHLAGMKDSKVIVAINTDPDAPIFEVADYGLVADLHQAVEELRQKL